MKAALDAWAPAAISSIKGLVLHEGKSLAFGRERYLPASARRFPEYIPALERLKALG